MRAVASSRRGNDPALRPDAALDRDSGTAWLASTRDAKPALTISWPEEATVSRLRWEVAGTLAASKPSQLQIVAGGSRQTVTPDRDGWVTFKAVRTKQLQVVVTGINPLQTLDRASGFATVLPIGASEIAIPGADKYRLALKPYQPVRLACGFGPALVIGGAIVRTRVSGTADDVVHRTPMSVIPCDRVPTLPKGPIRLSLRANSLVEPQELVFHNADAPASKPAATTAAVSIVQQSPEHRLITVNSATVDQVLNVHENANPGWRAELDGKPLTPVRLEGWQQGWIIPAGAGGVVHLRFTPGNLYRALLIFGLLLLVGLVAVAFPGRRRRRRMAHRTRPDDEELSLPEAAHGRAYGLLGAAGMVLIGGFWGLGVLVGVLVAVRQRVPMRFLVSGAGALAGLGAALSINADEAGIFGTLSIASALVLAACMVVRLDAEGGRLLARTTRRVPRAKPRQRPEQR
jgi:arabinofuranan 3-O-arabinosyltransferase